MAIEGAAFGTAQLILQAYEGGDGWWLDEVRIVTSDCMAMHVQQLESALPLRATCLRLARRAHCAPCGQGILSMRKGGA
ncbi:MAG: hypothetical protein IPJ85_16235 [Flavobacteriales bacterium]|nr:hypothetical protein [Flavobacteriales bacterium]